MARVERRTGRGAGRDGPRCRGINPLPQLQIGPARADAESSLHGPGRACYCRGMHSTTAVPAIAFRKVTWRETTVLLAVAWLVPLLVHLLPWSGERPLGAHLLPMFWAPLVAAYFYGAALGAAIAVFAPAVNLLVTGLPALPMMGTLAAETVVFAVLVAAAVRRRPRWVVVAPLAGAVAIAVVLLLQPLVSAGVFDAAAFGRAFTASLPGLVVMAALNAALVWFYPKGAAKPHDAAGV